MAKRRNLEIPSSDQMQRLEEEFRRSNPIARSGVAPIAQVAAETAAVIDPRSAELRIAAAKDKVDAEAYRDAQGRGLVLLDLHVEEIEADALVRDRLVIDAEELEELKGSIAKTGLRLPIEVFVHEGGYGLLSGYRRLMAVKALRQMTQDPKYDRIKALLREPEAMGGSFAAMIEENEIRSALSHFERGRIAVVAAQQGAFVNTEAAVEALFPMASKAKRSKIRSFALIYEELGDMLKFPDQIREKEGLKLAAALRDGAEEKLRIALGEGNPRTPLEEAEMIAAALEQVEAPEPEIKRGGRPKRERIGEVKLPTGYVLRAEQDAKGWSIRLGGDRLVDRELVETLIREISYLLGQPK